MNPTPANRTASLLVLFLIIMGLGGVLLLNPSPEPDLIPTLNPIATALVIPSEIDLHRTRGDLQVALYYLESLAMKEGWTASLHAQAGNLYSDMDDLNQALPHWEAALRMEVTPNLLRRVADLYIQRGDWGTAYERVERLLQIIPDDPWGLYYGGLLLAPSDPAVARVHLSRAATYSEIYIETAQNVISAIGSDFSDPLISSRVGAVLASEQEWSLAENAFQQAAAINYPFPEATAYVGLMLAQQRKIGENWIQQAVELAPENPDVRYVEGLYWRVVGEPLRSIEALLTSIILAPTVPEFYAELGNTYRIKGDLSEAEYWLQTALQISGNDPTLQEALNRLYTDESFALTPGELNVSRMARAQQDDPSVLSANGYVLHILGDSEAGLAMVERALEADPENVRAQFDKARILFETGQSDEARSLLIGLAEGDSPFAPTAERLLQGMN